MQEELFPEKTIMSDRIFLDTNIIVYSFFPGSGFKNEISKKLIKSAFDQNIGCISFQVIQEFLNVATTKFKTTLTKLECDRILIELLDPMCSIYPSLDLYLSAIEIKERLKYSFYDSLIISSALDAHCSILYSEDLQHNQKIEGLTIISPYIEH